MIKNIDLPPFGLVALKSKGFETYRRPWKTQGGAKSKNGSGKKESE